jgi:hypothetical protein
MAKLPTRWIKLQKLTDGNVHSMLDDGCGKSGEPNVARQQLIQMLEKTIVEKDDHGQVVFDEDGRPLELNLYRLAETPPKMNYDLNDEDQAALARADDFDRKYLKHDGEWLRPSDRWKTASAKFKAARDQKHEEAQERAKEQMQQEAGRVLSDLLALAKQNPASAPRETRHPQPPATGGSAPAATAPGAPADQLPAGHTTGSATTQANEGVPDERLLELQKEQEKTKHEPKGKR